MQHLVRTALDHAAMVGVLPAQTHVQSAWLQRLKLKLDKLLSSFPLNFKLRPYVTDPAELKYMEASGLGEPNWDAVAGGVLITSSRPTLNRQ